MPSVQIEKITKTLETYTDPYLKANLVERKCIKSLELDDDCVELHIRLPYPADGIIDELKVKFNHLLEPVLGGMKLNLSMDFEIISHAKQAGLMTPAGVKNIIAISSAKGGVGKSTSTVNLALALSKLGAKVAVLDADIYGPSQPMMLGELQTKPQSQDNKTIEPVISHGIKSMSIGYLVDQESAVAWRGPMVTRALQQLFNDTNWGEVDYLLVDLPPGTGDIQLTLAQKIPVSGAILVTTPQDIALIDVQRGLNMFHKVKIPVLGVLENMSVHICSKCGHHDPIFGEGGAVHFAQQNDINLLAQMPLSRTIREQTDAGNPTVIAEPESDIAALYQEAALRAVGELALSAKDYRSKFPKIVVERDS